MRLVKVLKPPQIAIKTRTEAGARGLGARQRLGPSRGTTASLGPEPARVSLLASVLQTQGPSDKVSQDIPEKLPLSSRARAGIHPERRGKWLRWNAWI